MKITPKINKEYALFRTFDKKDEIYGWHVSLARRGHIISRHFFDNTYGSAESAFIMAKAYRDAAIKLFPPQTNFEVAMTPRKNNTSGVPGVHAIKYKGRIVGWEASILSNGIKKRRSFTVTQYGSEASKVAAIAQREAWLHRAGVYFKSSNPLATKVAKNRFSEYLEPKIAPSWTPEDNQAIKKKLTELDDYFDTLRPPRLIVSIRVRSDRNSLTLYLSNSNTPSQKKEKDISTDKHSLDSALSILWDHTSNFLQEVYGHELYIAFKAIYRKAFTEENFDKTNGLSIKVFPEAIMLSFKQPHHFI